MTFNLIYITTKNKQEAQKIGNFLVKERLAACVNIIDKMISLYWWKGKVCKSYETILIAKTKKSLVKKVIQKAKSLHSYDCPCIVSLPINNGNPNFLKWIGRETK